MSDRGLVDILRCRHERRAFLCEDKPTSRMITLQLRRLHTIYFYNYNRKIQFYKLFHFSIEYCLKLFKN